MPTSSLPWLVWNLEPQTLETDGILPSPPRQIALFLRTALLRCFSYRVIDFPRHCSVGFAVNVLGNCWAKINLQKLLASFAQIFLPEPVEFNRFSALLPKHHETVAF